MQKNARFWDAARTLAKLKGLVEPGVIGTYRSVEVTEILGFLDERWTNFLTLAVAEPTEVPTETDIDWGSVRLNQRRHRLPKPPKERWQVCIMQYRLPLETFLEKVAEFAKTGQWKPTPLEIQTGTLKTIPPQFVPRDGLSHHPWNGILKNNFFEGSHVFELFDTTKQHVKFLLDDSSKLTSLASIVEQYLPPLKVDGMSDRLGNVIIQLPVTVLSTAVRGSPESDHIVAIAWSPDAPSRSVEITAEIWQDSTVTGFDSGMISKGELKLQLHSPGGGARRHVWDKERRILLSATPEEFFITSMAFSRSVKHQGLIRELGLADSTGKRVIYPVALKKNTEPQSIIGSIPERPREPWVAQRVFDESASSLEARKEFVQYGIYKAQSTERCIRGKEALQDLVWLIDRHGKEGVWLWDPFLDANDILRTLCCCPHYGVPLRALTAGKTFPCTRAKQNNTESAPLRKQAQQKKLKEAQELDDAMVNPLGLDLEFRIREGSAGWAFHDRFIIFPRAQGAALAWSLGTSINSFGVDHHILQKVSHGERIARAFQDLWKVLEDPKYLIWKTPKTSEQEQ